MADNLKKRAEGQLWIDRNAPHGLKYHTHDITYQLTPEEPYEIKADNNTPIPAGSVLAVGYVEENNTVKQVIKLAQFPKDIDRVVGLCPVDVPAGETIEASVMKSGSLVLPASGDNCVFEQQTTDISDWKKMIGAPVYWFIGRTYKNGNSYSYGDPSSNKGKLTLSTPSGMRWGTGTSCDDNSLNVGYSNLPIVGTVAEVNGTGNDTTVTVNINISKFESSLEWNWPYYSKVGSSSSDEISGNMEISIRHGLFPSIMTSGTENYYNFRPRCFCDAIIFESNTNDTEHKALIGVDNYYGLIEGEQADNDKRTEILIKSNILSGDKKRINVTGKVVYQFVKQYN